MTTCIHHWIIEAQEGPVSIGVCKHCGDIRKFNNGLPVWKRNEMHSVVMGKYMAPELQDDDDGLP